MVQNLSQKSVTSAQDFCERYPIEKTQSKFTRLRRANVSSSAQPLMTVGRPAQTHGPSSAAQCWLAATRVLGRSGDTLFEHVDPDFEKEFGLLAWRP